MEHAEYYNYTVVQLNGDHNYLWMILKRAGFSKTGLANMASALKVEIAF